MENVIKVTLSSKKVVMLKEFKIRHKDMAIKACSKEANGDALVLSTLVQNELIKLLVCDIDGKKMKPSDLLSLDDHFTMADYGQLSTVIQELMGDTGNLEKPQIEIVTSGSK